MQIPSLEIRQATIADLPVIAPLFDAYRQFYRMPANEDGAGHFLRDRMQNNQSTIFLCLDGPDPAGFCQLYPSFSSGSMAPILILNDLYVAPERRGRGAGSALLGAAADYGRSVGAVRVTLSTETTNVTAQALYEKLGWKCDTTFLTYQLALPPA